MNPSDFRKNIQLKFNGLVKKSDSYNKYEYLIRMDKVDNISKSHDISDIDISLAFKNYTSESNVDLYINSYRPDSPEKFLIDPNDLLVNIENLFVTNSPPENISTWSNIKFNIIVTNIGELEEDIDIVPYINGISPTNNKSTSSITQDR